MLAHSSIALTAWLRGQLIGPAVSVGLAVHSARLVTHHLAVLKLDDTLAHRVHDRGIMGRHHDGRTGSVDAVENLHDSARGARVDHLGYDLADEAPWLADDLKREPYVLKHVFVRKQSEVLENAADLPSKVRNLPVGQPGEILASYMDPATGRPL